MAHGTDPHDAHGHDAHGHDAHGHGHDDHGHGHDDHGQAHAPPPAPVEAPAPPPPNPATREAELRVLQAAFHLTARSLFTYFMEPGSLTAVGGEEKRLLDKLANDQKSEIQTEDALADLIRERGQEPMPRAFPEKFTALNFISPSAASAHIREDVATHKESLERLLAILPAEATATVRDALQKFLAMRTNQLLAWADEERKANEAVAARLAARKAAKPAGKA